MCCTHYTGINYAMFINVVFVVCGFKRTGKREYSVNVFQCMLAEVVGNELSVLIASTDRLHRATTGTFVINC